MDSVRTDDADLDALIGQTFAKVGESPAAVLKASARLQAMIDTNDAADREQLAAAKFIDPRTVPGRFSLLKQMNLSPAHYLEACQRDQDDSLASRLGGFSADRSEAFRIGTGCHAMLTGLEVAVYTGGARNPNHKKWQAFEKDCADRGVVEILSPREHALVTDVTNAIRARPDAMKLLFDGTIREQRIDWEWNGKAMRSTPDARTKKYTVDLKSAQSAEPEQFRRQSKKFFYHCQGALYSDAMERTGEGRPEDTYVIAVEKTRPYPITIFRFTAELLELGQKLNRLWLERLLNCERNNHWPVYAPCPAVVDLEMDDRDS